MQNWQYIQGSVLFRSLYRARSHRRHRIDKLVREGVRFSPSQGFVLWPFFVLEGANGKGGRV
jgi:hypothetical protein